MKSRICRDCLYCEKKDGQFFCKKKCRLIKDFRKCPEYEKEDFDLILDKWICFGEYRRMHVNREFKWD